jgi:hypothetical protein
MKKLSSIFFQFSKIKGTPGGTKKRITRRSVNFLLLPALIRFTDTVIILFAYLTNTLSIPLERRMNALSIPLQRRMNTVAILYLCLKVEVRRLKAYFKQVLLKFFYTFYRKKKILDNIYDASLHSLSSFVNSPAVCRMMENDYEAGIFA